MDSKQNMAGAFIYLIALGMAANGSLHAIH